MRPAIVLLFVVLAGLQVRLWVGLGSLHDVKELQAAIAVQQTEVERLHMRNDLLRAEVDDLRNNLESIEERARYELGLIRRGETFFLIPEESS